MALLHTENFDGYTIGSSYENHDYWGETLNTGNQPQLAPYTISNDFYREGSRCLKLELFGDGTTSVYRNEVHGPNYGLNGVPTQTGAPAAGVTRDIGYTVERWMAISFLIPETCDMNDGNNGGAIMWQVQNNPAVGSPVLALEVGAKGYAFSQNFDSVLNRAGDLGADPPRGNGRTYSLGGFYPGIWEDFVFHFKFEHTSPGITEVFRNKRLVHRDLLQPNAWNLTNPKHNIHFGIYLPSWRSSVGVPAVDSRARNRVVYCDSIKIGDETSSLIEVSPSVSPVKPTRAQSRAPI